MEAFGYIGHVGRFVNIILRAIFLFAGVFGRFLLFLWELCFWMKVVRRANDVVWDFITDYFSKVVGFSVGF